MEEDLSPWQKLGSLIFMKRGSVSRVILQLFVKPGRIIHRQVLMEGHSWAVQSNLHSVLTPKFAFTINNRYCMSKYLQSYTDDMYYFI